LFILGGGSDYVRETDWPLVRRLFPGAQRVTIEGAGHWLHAERPDVFAASVQAFLA
jgi:esterase